MNEHAQERSSTSRDSARAATVAVGGMTVAALITSLAVLGVGGERTAEGIGLYGASVVGFACAAIALIAAGRIPDRLLRSTWQLMGTGIALLAAGDAAWAIGHTARELDKAVFSFADLFYISAYVVLGVAMLRYAASFRSRVDMAWIVTETLVATAALGITAWMVFLAPAVRVVGGLEPQMLPDLIYVLLDFVLLIAPMTCLILSMSRAPDHNVASPWSAVALGILVMTAADIAWFLERAHEGWEAGSLADFGFMVSVVLIATGAAAAVDAYRRAERQRVIAEA